MRISDYWMWDEKPMKFDVCCFSITFRSFRFLFCRPIWDTYCCGCSLNLWMLKNTLMRDLVTYLCIIAIEVMEWFFLKCCTSKDCFVLQLIFAKKFYALMIVFPLKVLDHTTTCQTKLKLCFWAAWHFKKIYCHNNYDKSTKCILKKIADSRWQVSWVEKTVEGSLRNVGVLWT